MIHLLTLHGAVLSLHSRTISSVKTALFEFCYKKYIIWKPSLSSQMVHYENLVFVPQARAFTIWNRMMLHSPGLIIQNVRQKGGAVQIVVLNSERKTECLTCWLWSNWIVWVARRGKPLTKITQDYKFVCLKLNVSHDQLPWSMLT